MNICLNNYVKTYPTLMRCCQLFSLFQQVKRVTGQMLCILLFTWFKILRIHGSQRIFEPEAMHSVVTGTVIRTMNQSSQLFIVPRETKFNARTCGQPQHAKNTCSLRLYLPEW